MKRYLWLAGVLLVFFLIYYFPARLAWSLLPPAAGEAVELYGISGPWHRGTATAARLAGVPVGELQWRLRPLPWHPLRAEISGELATGAPFGGRLSAGWGGIAGDGPVVLRELAAELPLSYLAGQLAAYDLAVDGTLQLAFERLELVQGMPRRATGYFELHDFRALEPLKLELGDFRGEVGTTGDELRLELRDLAGRLKLDGVAVLTPAGEYDISAELTPRRADDEELRRVIGFLGPPDKDGTVRVEFAGRLR